MRLTMKERKAVTKASCKAYRKARKRDKSRILNQFVEMTGYHRTYAASLLRNHGRRVQVDAGGAGRRFPWQSDHSDDGTFRGA